MVSDAAGSAAIMALLLILPIGALVSRRLPVATLLRYTLAWLIIAGIGFVIIMYFT